MSFSILSLCLPQNEHASSSCVSAPLVVVVTRRLRFTLVRINLTRVRIRLTAGGCQPTVHNMGVVDSLVFLIYSNFRCSLTNVETDGAPATQLRSAGLRVTAARLAVLAVLGGGGHHSVESLVGAVRERIGSVSNQAVYDVLGALEVAGLARRIVPAGSPALFEARAGDNHHHLVCRGC